MLLWSNLNGVLKPIKKYVFGKESSSLVSEIIYLTLLLALALVIEFIPNRINVDMTYYDFLWAVWLKGFKYGSYRLLTIIGTTKP